MKITLTDLEQAARSLDVKVTYEDLKTSKGGSCRVMESRRIIINKHLTVIDKANLLARELGRFDLTGLDLPDRVLKKILHESDRPAESLKRSA
jgi:hypothetical protein